MTGVCVVYVWWCVCVCAGDLCDCPSPFQGDSTPLMEAASGGYADIVKLLIDHGANVNAKSR